MKISYVQTAWSELFVKDRKKVLIGLIPLFGIQLSMPCQNTDTYLRVGIM